MAAKVRRNALIKAFLPAEKDARQQLNGNSSFPYFRSFFSKPDRMYFEKNTRYKLKTDVSPYDNFSYRHPFYFYHPHLFTRISYSGSFPPHKTYFLP